MKIFQTESTCVSETKRLWIVCWNSLLPQFLRCLQAKRKYDSDYGGSGDMVKETL